jgi:hypothetical protein
MVALIASLILALITRKQENLREFMRRWAAFTWWIAAVEVLWFMAVEAYALVEMAARGSYSSLIATLAGLAGEAVIVRGAWADFAAGGILFILAAVLDELNTEQLAKLLGRRSRRRENRRARGKYCFVLWKNDEEA